MDSSSGADGSSPDSKRGSTENQRTGKARLSVLERAKRRLSRETPDEPRQAAVEEPDDARPERVQEPRARYVAQDYAQERGSNGDDVYWRPLIDPMRMISAVMRSTWLIILMTVLGGIAGLLIALSTSKEYYSATEVLFDPRDLQILGYDLTSGGLPSDATLALIENQVGIIRSGKVLSGVVERLNLANDPEFNGQGGGGLLGSLFSSGGGEAGDAARRQAIAVGNLAKKLNIGRNDRTFIIHIGATTQDPDKSALIANTTADVYLQETGNLEQATMNRANTALTGRLDELQAQVEAAEKAVADFKTQNDIVDTQGRLIADDEMTRLNDQLSTARARTGELNARVASSRNLDVDQALGGALPEQVASPVMTELLSQYATLAQQAERIGARLGPRHPDYQALQAELDGARQAIANELRRVTASTEVELRRAVQVEQDLAARLAGLKVEKGNLEGKQVTLRELQREAEARRSVYEGSLLRARQTGQQLNTANVSVISQAHPPLLPTGPRRLYIVLAGAVAGFLAGVALAAARGAYESLRGDMAARRGPVAPAGPSGASAPGFRRGHEDDFPLSNGDFDPPPYDPGPRGGRRAFSQATQAEPRPSVFSKQSVAQANPAARHGGYERAGLAIHQASGYHDEAYPQPGPFEPWQGTRDYPLHGGYNAAVPPRDSAMPYSPEMAHPADWPSTADDKTAFEEEFDATPAVEELRRNLRALRDEIDALAERRARHYG